MPKQVNDASFARDVLEATAPVLLMFSAPWAGPCNLARPTLEALAQRFGNQIDFCEFNLDDNPNAPARYGVRSVPSFYLFNKGVPLAVVSGAVSPEYLEGFLEPVL
jgi:thioredoxin 1